MTDIISEVIAELQDVATKLDASPPQVDEAKPLVADAIAQLQGLGAHTYWQIQVISLTGGTRLEITELGLGDANQVALTTANCRCTSADAVGMTSSYTDKQECTLLSDGSATTEEDLLFNTGVLPTITQQFDTPVNAAFIRQARRDTANRQVATCEVSYSDDGTNWTQKGGTISLPFAVTNFTMTSWVAVD